MNELPRQKLREIVVSYGLSIYKDPQRCRALLLDVCQGEYQAEIRVIIAAQEEQVARALLSSSSREPYVSLCARLTRHLDEKCGFKEDIALWGVETWALALGISSVFSGQETNCVNEGNDDHTVQGNVSAQQSVQRRELQVLFVSQRGNGDHTTITEALKHACANTTIYVSPGTYNESLCIEKDIELVTLGEVIIESAVPCLAIMSQRVSVTGFTIKGILPDRQPDRKHTAAIQVTTGMARIIRCNIVSASTSGIEVAGRATWLTLFDSNVHHISGSGIVFSDAAQGSLKMCKIYQCATNGIELLEGAMFTLENCQISEGKRNGIFLCGNAEARIVRGTISNNYKHGIQVQSGKLSMEKSSVTDNRASGLVVQGQGEARLMDCTLRENTDYGVWALNDSQMHIQGGSISMEKGRAALAFTCQSQGEVKQCSIMSQDIGVIIKDYSLLSLNECTIASRLEYILAEGQSQVTAMNCEATRNAKVSREEASTVNIRHKW